MGPFERDLVTQQLLFQRLVTMAADTVKIRNRAVIEFLTLEGRTPKEIHERMAKVYVDSAPSYATVKRWAVEAKHGRESLDDEARSGRPPSAVTPETISALEAMIMEDRRITIVQMSKALDISVGSVETIIHEHLKMNKVSARWVPKMLTIDMKMDRREKSHENLELMDSGMVTFEKRIVTGDETWVYHYDPESKQQSMTWKHASSPTPKKFKASRSSGKVLCTVFWDAAGILLIDYLPVHQTITGIYYADVLHKLRAAIKEKRRGKLRSGPLLLHDNAPAHTSHVAKAAVKDCGFVELPHPPYSPDLAPSDFFLFPNLKSALKGRRFADNEEVKDAFGEFFDDQDVGFFQQGIRMLKDRYRKCVELGGDYVEK